MDSFDRRSSASSNRIPPAVERDRLPGRPVTHACWNRIRKMEELGIITGRVALLDAGVSVLGDGIRPRSRRAPTRNLAFALGGGRHRHAEVVDVYRMSGDVDYMLRVVVPGIDAYDGFYAA